MNTHLTETTNLSRTILSKDDIECAILALAPGEQMPCTDAHWTQEHLLFVIDGLVLVQNGDVTQYLSRDEVLHVPAGRNSMISADPAGWAKLLRIDFTRRTIVEPPIFTVPPFAPTSQP